ncbi:MAG: glutathione S-transferase N-terminal domain-containing protein [Solirubrobacterales bacterium]
MAVKLHRCGLTFVKLSVHPCWNVQKALDQEGIEYEVVKDPLRDRKPIEELSGQSKYPVIEFEDGRVYREESKDMVARIKAGKLFEDPASPASPAPAD